MPVGVRYASHGSRLQHHGPPVPTPPPALTGFTHSVTPRPWSLEGALVGRCEGRAVHAPIGGTDRRKGAALKPPCPSSRRGGGGGWHKALVVGSVSLWWRLLASRL